MALADGARKRQADIATRHRPNSAALQNPDRQFGGGRFSVCAGDRDHWAGAVLESQLEFPDERDFFGDHILDQRNHWIDARAKHGEIVGFWIGLRIATQQNSSAPCAEGLCFFAQGRRIAGLANGHTRTLVEQKRGSGLATMAKTEDNRFFAALVHFNEVSRWPARAGRRTRRGSRNGR